MLGKIQAIRLSALMLVAGVVGCSPLPRSGAGMLILRPNVDVTNIQALQQEQQLDRVVHIQGKVVRQVPLVQKQAYEIKDRTGSIWIVTQKQAPKSGEAVLVKGKVRYQQIPIGSQDLGEVYVEEQTKL
ncbi:MULTISPECIES: hypothetical protein [Trichocoleus]|uniref:Uncharacterized protein n=1 Tax=Trichocoleus desertorum GB2-A4 TaxID=2933944 RepID=A0ABV0J4P7_9CYAN|nr:hypothetical protein [Trichocoleus sp. FACHB-46]MBD1863591.1 hypothetical protein [Trichocoleus sp. FACHB-46]